jgi:hypothetical protein
MNAKLRAIKEARSSGWMLTSAVMISALIPWIELLIIAGAIAWLLTQ